MTMRLSRFLLFCGYISTTATSTHAFPSMLVESRSGCMLELTTEEVIMNQVVVAHKDSSRKDLYVAVVGDDGTLSRGPISFKGSQLLSSAPTKFTVRLVNPGDDIPDLQYAIETTEGATFKGGGCEGKRSLGRLQDDLGLELTIHAPDKEIRVWAGWATQHEAVTLTDELVFTPVTVTVQEGEAAKPKGKAEPNENEAERIKKTTEAEPPPNKGDALEEAHREAVEEAHKDALDTEIQVLRDEVKEIHDHDERQDDHGGGELENKKKDILLKKELDSVQKNASDAHEDIITRFKEAYQKKHMGEPKNKRPDLKRQKDFQDPDPTLSAPEKATMMKVKHDEWMRHYGKRQTEEMLESQEKLLKKIKARRQKGLREKWIKKYNQDYVLRIDLWQYTYGVVVMVVGMLSVIQLCLCIARHGKKGRREL